MNRPKVIIHVVYALGLNILLSSFAAAFNAWAGHITLVGIVINISISIFVLVLAYKIYYGSNGARYLYTIFFVITCFLFLGYIGQEIPDMRFWVKVVQLPINFYILYCLFCSDSSAWFGSSQD